MVLALIIVGAWILASALVVAFVCGAIAVREAKFAHQARRGVVRTLPVRTLVLSGASTDRLAI